MQNNKKTVLSCKNLKVTFGPVTAVDDLDLTVFGGECFGLLGPNGAGKTTTVEVFEGLLKPVSGQIEVFGKRWGDGQDRLLRSRMGIVLQETHLVDTLTVLETLQLFRSFYGDGRKIDEIIELVGLEEKRNSRISKMSGGQRQRLALGCALISRPELLFLDEPTTGLDPQARLRVWEVVKDFVTRGGTALVTTHYMDEAAHLCDRIAIMDHGKLMALDTPKNLIKALGGERVIEIEFERETSANVFADLPMINRIDRRGGSLAFLVEDITQALPEILAFANSRSLAIRSLLTHEATLDDVFIHLTGRGLRNG
ncbi:MAG: ABC transporter ATP-binding protein [Oligoflexales bacterium]|nr:ABC transporter ATP-binding protein [Oligoflexales bacterium]